MNGLVCLLAYNKKNTLLGFRFVQLGMEKILIVKALLIMLLRFVFIHPRIGTYLIFNKLFLPPPMSFVKEISESGEGMVCTCTYELGVFMDKTFDKSGQLLVKLYFQCFLPVRFFYPAQNSAFLLAHAFWNVD